jgi:hypothetical protein
VKLHKIVIIHFRRIDFRLEIWHACVQQPNTKLAFHWRGIFLIAFIIFLAFTTDAFKRSQIRKDNCFTWNGISLAVVNVLFLSSLFTTWVRKLGTQKAQTISFTNESDWDRIEVFFWQGFWIRQIVRSSFFSQKKSKTLNSLGESVKWILFLFSLSDLSRYMLFYSLKWML